MKSIAKKRNNRVVQEAGMKKIYVFLILCLLSLSISTAKTKLNFSQKVKSFTLANGMSFYVYERRQSPTFAGIITIKVGSVDEREGQTGLAHLFEHLAFKGTPKVGTKDYEREKKILGKIDAIGKELTGELGKGERADQEKIKHLQEEIKKHQVHHQQYIIKNEMATLYAQNGAQSLNATTGRDTTDFFVKLPANRLELWFLLESERFKHPVLREFYKEKQVIYEEKRNSENDPDGFLLNEFFHLAFTLHPYRHPTIGYSRDIRMFNKEDALNFFKTHYVSSNMVAAVVGDISFEKVKTLAGKYFGDLPPGEAVKRPILKEPKQNGERRTVLKYDAEPRIIIGYHIPSYPAKENVILRLVNILLLNGQSSRMYKDLVIEKKIARNLFSGLNFPGGRYSNLFMIYCHTQHPHTPGELETAIYQHLEKLKTEPVSQKEIEKAINQVEASFYRELDDNLFIASRIALSASLYGDPAAEFIKLEQMKTITPGDIMETANKIFIEPNRTVAILLKKETGGMKK